MLLEAEKVIGPRFKIDLDTWIEIVGQSHREVAVALAQKWQLNASLQHVIAGGNKYHPGTALATNIVCFANETAKFAGKTVGPVDTARTEDLVTEGVDLLGLDWRFVHELRTTIQDFEDRPEE